MKMLTRIALGAALLSAGLATASEAQAPTSSLRVRSIEHGDWAHTVATLQADRQAEGRSIHLVVEDAYLTRSACDSYRLSMDEHGAQAFREVSCDPQTGATELRLVDRTALFILGTPVSRPRRVAISVLELREGSAEGGAAQPVEPELRCQIAVQPMLVDLLNGQRVRATPDRYELRPVGAGVRAVVREDAWSLRSGSLEVEYELVERASGQVVLRDRIQLHCGSAAPAPQAGAIELYPDRVFRGATITRGPDDHGSCGGQEGPEQWYVLTLDTPRHVGLRLVSEFDATLYIREGSIEGREIACRDDTARLETIEMTLEAGTYYVAVDGTGTHGRYRLMSFEGEADLTVLPRGPRGEVQSGSPLRSELRPTASLHRASCGGELAPEHVYTLSVESPSRVWVRLESRFNSALYVRGPQGQEIGCRSALGFPHQVRHARVAANLAPGEYRVYVDGADPRARGGSYQLSVAELPLR